LDVEISVDLLDSSFGDGVFDTVGGVEGGSLGRGGEGESEVDGPGTFVVLE